RARPALRRDLQRQGLGALKVRREGGWDAQAAAVALAWVGGRMRKPTPSMLKALMQPIIMVRFTRSASVNWASTAAYASSGARVADSRVSASVQPSAARSRSV